MHLRICINGKRCSYAVAKHPGIPAGSGLTSKQLLQPPKKTWHSPTLSSILAFITRFDGTTEGMMA